MGVLGQWCSTCFLINVIAWALLEDEATSFNPLALLSTTYVLLHGRSWMMKPHASILLPIHLESSRSSAAAFRLRCNWNASTLAVFIVGLQRFALLGPVHRFIFHWWIAATLVFPLWHVFLCVKDIWLSTVLSERMRAVRSSLMSSAVLCEHFIDNDNNNIDILNWH